MFEGFSIILPSNTKCEIQACEIHLQLKNDII